MRIRFRFEDAARNSHRAVFGISSIENYRISQGQLVGSFLAVSNCPDDVSISFSSITFHGCYDWNSRMVNRTVG
jgi:hypothetical protein